MPLCLGTHGEQCTRRRKGATDTPLGSRPLNHVQVVCRNGIYFGVLAQEGAVSPCRLDHFQVSSGGSSCADTIPPLAVIRSGQLTNAKVATRRDLRARTFIPRAGFCMCPLKDVEMPSAGGRRASIRVPGTASGAHPQRFPSAAAASQSTWRHKQSSSRSRFKRLSFPWAADGQQAVSRNSYTRSSGPIASTQRHNASR